MTNIIEEFISLGEKSDISLSREGDLAKVEKSFIQMLGIIKNNMELKSSFLDIFSKSIKSDYMPIELIQFCMRELKWPEVKLMAIKQLEHSNDPRLISSIGSILEVYETEWPDEDLYDYYSGSINTDD